MEQNLGELLTLHLAEIRPKQILVKRVLSISHNFQRASKIKAEDESVSLLSTFCGLRVIFTVRVITGVELLKPLLR